jgi:hypothetical protein
LRAFLRFHDLDATTRADCHVDLYSVEYTSDETSNDDEEVSADNFKRVTFSNRDITANRRRVPQVAHRLPRCKSIFISIHARFLFAYLLCDRNFMRIPRDRSPL